MFKFRHLIGSILLISGTTIGGGMLGLPVSTSQGGFLPSLVIYFLTWLFMAATGLLLLEMCICHGKETNIVTLAKETLGPIGLVVTWVVYLYLFYCLTIAYVVGTQSFINYFIGQNLNVWLSSFIFLAAFAPLIYIGARAVEEVNNIFMVGLIVSYIAFLFLGVPHIQLERLTEVNFKYSLIAFPVIFVSFGYQGIVPSITFYLKENAKAVRLAILIGSFIPFIVYVIWEALVLGIVPQEYLLAALKAGETAVAPFQKIIGMKKITFVGQCFGFFALATSLLGVTLGLRDFLADGLKIKKDAKGRAFLCALIFIPPILLSIYYPNIFLKALSLAGGIGGALILGLLPILMVWSKRYVKKLNNTGYQVAGGKGLLIVLTLFCLFEITFVTLYSLGILKFY